MEYGRSQGDDRQEPHGVGKQGEYSKPQVLAQGGNRNDSFSAACSTSPQCTFPSNCPKCSQNS